MGLLEATWAGLMGKCARNFSCFYKQCCLYCAQDPSSMAKARLCVLLVLTSKTSESQRGRGLFKIAITNGHVFLGTRESACTHAIVHGSMQCAGAGVDCTHARRCVQTCVGICMSALCKYMLASCVSAANLVGG